MTEIDFFGYAATAFILLGTWLSIDKDSYGWSLRLFGSLIWAYIGLRIGLVSLWLSEAVFAALAYYGYRQWREQEKAEESWRQEQIQWLQASVEALEKTDEAIEREREGPKVAAKRRSPRKKQVQTTRRRRSKSTDGKRRSRSNAKPRSPKKTRRDV